MADMADMADNKSVIIVTEICLTLAFLMYPHIAASGLRVYAKLVPIRAMGYRLNALSAFSGGRS